MYMLDGKYQLLSFFLKKVQRSNVWDAHV